MLPIMVAAPVTKIASTTRDCPRPGVPILVDSGGYVVHPAAAEPSCTQNDAITSADERVNVQNDSMFSFGNAISRAPIMSGMQKLPNAPIRMGVMAKKIIARPCIVNIEVYVPGPITPPDLARKM